MDRQYWEDIAHNYNSEIFDVFRNDRSGVIVAAIERYASRRKTVIDIGCAVGKWLPFLSERFKQVTAADISAINLQLAKENCSTLKNVEYVRMDMSADKLKIRPYDFAICINAILTDSHKKRINFFRSLSKSVKRGGALVIVVPSIESALFSSFMFDQWKLKDNEPLANSRPADAIKKYNNLRRGIVDIDKVATKHHQREEMIVLLRNAGFETVQVSKVEYEWSTEFDNPPSWMKAPYPWDWLFVAEKFH